MAEDEEGGAKMQSLFLTASNSKIESRNRDTLDELASKFARLNISTPNNSITFVKSNFNHLTLTPGNYGGATIDKKNTKIAGVGDVRIERQVLVKADSTLENLHFVSDKSNSERNNASLLVKVQNTSSCLFVNCIFEKSAGDPNSATVSDEQAFVVIEANSAATFVGCSFTGSVTGSGFVVINRNTTTGSVAKIGTRNQTVRPHSNTYIVQEVYV